MNTFEMKHSAIAPLLHEGIITIAANMNARLAALQADPDLSPECRAQLTRAVRVRAQVELGQMAGVAGVDQAALAQVLAELAGPIPESAIEPPRRFWWKFWA